MNGCGCPIAETAGDMVDDCEEQWCDWSEDEEVLAEDQRCCECYAKLPQGSTAMIVTAYRSDDDGNPIDGDALEGGVTCVPCYRIRVSLYCGTTILGELRQLIGDEMGFDYVTGEDTWEIEDEDQFVLDIKREQERKEELKRRKEERDLIERFRESAHRQLAPPWWLEGMQKLARLQRRTHG